MAIVVFGLALSWVFLALGCWFAYQLLRQNGRILLRLEAVEQRLREIPAPMGEQLAENPLRGLRPLTESRINRNGLAPGTPAPLFRLPRVEGGELSLEEFRGHRVLLVFSDPHCGPCDELAPRLERVHRESPDVQIVMISRGEADLNRSKARQHGLTFPVVLQRHWEISRLFAKFATPIAYLIDERGIVAAGVAMGVDAILALLSGPASRPSDVPKFA